MQATAAPTTTPASAKRFRRDIEGLRALAVIGVLAFHFGVPGISGGFVGVDIFFVISGYLITGLLLEELESSGRIRFLRFYGRRMRRLLPALLLVTLVTLGAIVLLLSPNEQQRFAGTAAAASVYLSNLWFLLHSADYFAAQAGSNPFLHTWSLGVEEQFYLVWPALLFLAAGRRFRRARLAVAVSALTVATLALCVWLTGRDWPWAFYSSPARAWEFGLGGLAALAGVARWADRSKLAGWLEWLGAAALLLSFVLVKEASAFPGMIALLPAAGAVCVLLSGAAGSRRAPVRLLESAPFQWIGRRSYSIYLWHWPIIILAAALYPYLSAPGRILCAGLAVLLAAASYRWVENPIRNSPWLAASTTRSILLGVGLTLTGYAAARGVEAIGEHFAASPAQSAITATMLTRPLAGRRGCLILSRQDTPQECVFGDVSSSTSVVLFGDSHAVEWSTPLASIAQAEGWRMVTYLKAGCPAADIPVYDLELHRPFSECAKWREAAIAKIVQLRPKLIVIGEFASSYVNGRRSFGLGQDERLAPWIAGLRKSLNELRSSGASIVLLSDTPTPAEDEGTCIARALWRGTNAACDIPRSIALHPQVTLAERELVGQIPGARYVDLTSEFCGDQTCPAVRNGLQVYRDDSHVSNAFVMTLESPLRVAMLASMPGYAH